MLWEEREVRVSVRVYVHDCVLGLVEYGLRAWFYGIRNHDMHERNFVYGGFTEH